MARKKLPNEEIFLEKIISGGQALGKISDGRKCFVWGGLPGETVEVRFTKAKSAYVEGVAEKIIKPSKSRIEPKDPESFLSTSPWQIMDFDAEQEQKSQLIREALELHKINFPGEIKVEATEKIYNYRNKVEFSWFGDVNELGEEVLDLAFFRRGRRGKIPVEKTSLAADEINDLAVKVRDLLRTKNVTARNLKTLLIRCNQNGDCVWQLYTKDKLTNLITPAEAKSLPAIGGEIIFSNPKSPASVITERLFSYGETKLNDEVLGVNFQYACESFFQINIPIYEKALSEMKRWILPDIETLDLYSGVGSIGLTIGGSPLNLVEINEFAVSEMKQNIERLNLKNTRAILAPSEEALDFIKQDQTTVVDPPRAGLHKNVINRLIEKTPPRIIYLSCNPVTQARDVSLLTEKYEISHIQGYNFFPRTPHIENLIILDKKAD